jgi:thiamine monophosphate kinase
VRQLRDWKGSAIVESMSPQVLADYGRSCGQVLARADARTGDRIAIAGYLGRSDTADTAFTRFAEAYADQNERSRRAAGRCRQPSGGRGIDDMNGGCAQA